MQQIVEYLREPSLQTDSERRGERMLLEWKWCVPEVQERLVTGMEINVFKILAELNPSL